MSASTEHGSIEPILALTLLSLDLKQGQAASSRDGSTNLSRRGLWVEGLDTRFAKVWRGGSVVGLGTAESYADEISLALSLIASNLLKGWSPLPDKRQAATSHAQETSSPPPTVYIVAPHTYQTIPHLHSLLAKRVGNSPAAIDLLQNVQLLQFFDLAGLAESVAEIGERIYQSTREAAAVKAGASETPTDPVNELQHMVLIQGLTLTISATQRRSGPLQANALLASLTRNITQVSRLSGTPLVLLDVPVEVRKRAEAGIRDTKANHSSLASMEFDSAFSGPNGETFRLVCGSSLLSQILYGCFDCLVLVHDALGGVPSHQKEKDLRHELVIEVVKDRLGDTTGLWALWQPERA